MAFHSDHPTLADSLERLDLLKKVGNLVKTCSTPCVVGIYGDWGSGKTSFLRALELYLSGTSGVIDVSSNEVIKLVNTDQAHVTPLQMEEYREAQGMRKILNTSGARQGYPVVWFDAWRYQTESVPIAGLLKAIQREFSAGAQLAEFIRDNKKQATQALLALTPLIAQVAHLSPGVGTALATGTKAASNLLDSKPKDEIIALPLDQLREQLDHALEVLVDSVEPKSIFEKIKGVINSKKSNRAKGERRLVIVIDDLDRCEPAVAYRLLEGIKVFLNLKNCVFVLGVNSTRLLDHIANAYLGEAKDKETSIELCRYRAQDYLDKIINTHYTFKLVENTDDLVEKIMPPITINGEDQRQSIIDTLKAYRPLPPNPRRIKLLINMLSRYDGATMEGEPDPGGLICFAYLSQFHPEILRKCLYYKGYLDKFLNWATMDEQSLDADWEGLLPLPEFYRPITERPKATEQYPDPIDDNVLHIQPLLKKWWEEIQSNPAGDVRDVMKPYIILY